MGCIVVGDGEDWVIVIKSDNLEIIPRVCRGLDTAWQDV